MEMIRVYVDGKGNVAINGGGKTSGRGCYVCPEVGCVLESRKRSSLSRALGCPVPESVYKDLELIANSRQRGL